MTDEKKEQDLIEFEGYFRSQEFIANVLGLRNELAKLDRPTDQELLVSMLRNGRTQGHDQRNR